MIDLVNAERRKAGVPELKVSPKLCEAARIRAKESTCKSGHTRPNGTWCETILEDVNLMYYKIGNITNTVAYGENQVVGNHKNISASTALKGLLNSPQHKKIMLSDLNLYIGIAYVENNGNSSWIQSFGYLQ